MSLSAAEALVRPNCNENLRFWQLTRASVFQRLSSRGLSLGHPTQLRAHPGRDKSPNSSSASPNALQRSVGLYRQYRSFNDRGGTLGHHCNARVEPLGILPTLLNSVHFVACAWYVLPQHFSAAISVVGWSLSQGPSDAHLSFFFVLFWQKTSVAPEGCTAAVSSSQFSLPSLAVQRKQHVLRLVPAAPEPLSPRACTVPVRKRVRID